MQVGGQALRRHGEASAPLGTGSPRDSRRLPTTPRNPSRLPQPLTCTKVVFPEPAMPSTSTHTGAAAAAAPAAAAIFPESPCPSGAGGGRGPDVTHADLVVAPLPPGRSASPRSVSALHGPARPGRATTAAARRGWGRCRGRPGAAGGTTRAGVALTWRRRPHHAGR